jgi:hypothetical protein
MAFWFRGFRLRRTWLRPYPESTYRLKQVSQLAIKGGCSMGRVPAESRVEAGSNTSTVTLRVVGGDEKGSLNSETVK